MSQGVAPVVRARRQVGSRARRARLRTGSLGAAGAGVTAFLVLAGCAASPPPQAIQSDYTQASASPSPSASPISPTAPVRPPEMDRTDEVGAVAAARYFLELFAYAMVSGDTSEWDAVSTVDCTFCANVRGDITERYSDGGRFVGGGVTSFTGAAGSVNPQLGGYPVSVTYTIGEGAELDGTGATVKPMPQGSGSVVVDVLPAVDGWRLVELSSDPALSVFAQ